MNFDLNQLRGFEAILRFGSFRSAAEAIGVPQSSLSQQIARLETQLGHKLFTRTTRRVEATGRGLALRAYVDTILAATEEMRRTFDSSPIEAVLRIGVVEDLLCGDGPTDDPAAGGVRRALARWGPLHPRLGLRLRTGSSCALLQALDDGACDVVLVERSPGRMQGRHLCTRPLVWCGAPATLAAQPDGAVPLVTYPEPSVTRRLAEAALRRAGRPFHVVVEGEGRACIQAAVAGGFGIAAFDAHDVPADMSVSPEACGLPRIDPVEYVIDRRGDPAAPGVEALIDLLAATPDTRQPMAATSASTATADRAEEASTARHSW